MARETEKWGPHVSSEPLRRPAKSAGGGSPRPEPQFPARMGSPCLLDPSRCSGAGDAGRVPAGPLLLDARGTYPNIWCARAQAAADPDGTRVPRGAPSPAPVPARCLHLGVPGVGWGRPLHTSGDALGSPVPRAGPGLLPLPQFPRAYRSRPARPDHGSLQPLESVRSPPARGLTCSPRRRRRLGSSMARCPQGPAPAPPLACRTPPPRAIGQSGQLTPPGPAPLRRAH